MKPEQKKKLPNKKVTSSAKFEAKEQFTKSALENLKTENERLVNSLKNLVKLKNQKENRLTVLNIFYYYINLQIEK